MKRQNIYPFDNMIFIPKKLKGSDKFLENIMKDLEKLNRCKNNLLLGFSY